MCLEIARHNFFFFFFNANNRGMDPKWRINIEILL